VRVLLVEDDVLIASFVSQGLEQQGIVIDHVGSAEQALPFINATHYDGAIIDLMLPGSDGLSLIERLRGQGHQLPVLILSAKSSVDDKVRGFRQGGDDYLTKPFALAELTARLHALLRRPRVAPIPTTFAAGGVRLDVLARRVSRDGRDIDLQPKEFALLEYLMRNENIVLTKAMVLEQIWNYDFNPQTNAVDVLVSRLRAKIDRPFKMQLIHTVRGAGYVFRTETR
jgi:two-component system OmpR family response regulator